MVRLRARPSSDKSVTRGIYGRSASRALDKAFQPLVTRTTQLLIERAPAFPTSHESRFSKNKIHVSVDWGQQRTGVVAFGGTALFTFVIGPIVHLTQRAMHEADSPHVCAGPAGWK